jgi:hypothetical protein
MGRIFALDKRRKSMEIGGAELDTDDHAEI